MARAPRIEDPEATYHITARGNNGEVIYATDGDRADFLALLALVASRYRWSCRAYCLMSTHYHLLVGAPEGGLSAGMRELNGRYARTVNCRRGRFGHLFLNRFGAVLITRESHVLEASRYIVINPVRAGLCRYPEEWRWSSYRASVGLEWPAPFLDTTSLLQLFPGSPAESRARYAAFVGDRL